MESILSFLLGILVLFVLARFLILPLRVIFRLMLNGLAGGVVLVLFNIVGGVFGLSIQISPLNAIIAGIFGVPGVVGLLIWQML